MNKHFNRQTEKDRRRLLRRNQTHCEKIMWLNLRNRRLLGIKFRRQYSVDQYIIDFYAPELKLAIEVDGEVHNHPDQKEYDLKRQKYIESFGIRFVRITNEELLGNSERAFNKIKEVIMNIKQIRFENSHMEE